MTQKLQEPIEVKENDGKKYILCNTSDDEFAYFRIGELRLLLPPGADIQIFYSNTPSLIADNLGMVH